MNSTITQFNFKNTPKLKKLYIDPSTEIKGSINLTKTPIEWQKLDDETKYKEDSLLGVIYTSDTIFNNHIKLVSSKKELEKAQDTIRELYNELKNKGDSFSITETDLAEKIKLLEALQEERTLSEQQKKEATVEKDNLLKQIQELTKLLETSKDGDKKIKELEDLLPNDTEKQLIYYLTIPIDQLISFKDEVDIGTTTFKTWDWNQLRGHFVDVRKKLLELLEKLEQTNKTLEENIATLHKERKENAIEIQQLREKSKDYQTKIKELELNVLNDKELKIMPIMKQLMDDFELKTSSLSLFKYIKDTDIAKFEQDLKTIEDEWKQIETPNLIKLGRVSFLESFGSVFNILKKSKQLEAKTENQAREVEKIKEEYNKLQVKAKEDEVKLSSKEKEIQTHIVKIKELGETNTRDISSLQEIVKQKDTEINQLKSRLKQLEAQVKNLQPVKKPSQWDTATHLYFNENRDNNGKREWKRKDTNEWVEESSFSEYAKLTHLYFQTNKTTELPQFFPNSLLQLNCSNTQISSIPALPNSLQYLYCSNTQISSIPALPNSLQYLYCYNTQISSIPALPNSLLQLNCSNTQISSIPALPNSLQYLYCYNIKNSDIGFTGFNITGNNNVNINIPGRGLKQNVGRHLRNIVGTNINNLTNIVSLYLNVYTNQQRLFFTGDMSSVNFNSKLLNIKPLFYDENTGNSTQNSTFSECYNTGLFVRGYNNADW